MQMSFDEMYDEMLHDEFRSGSTGQAAARGRAHAGAPRDGTPRPRRPRRRRGRARALPQRRHGGRRRAGLCRGRRLPRRPRRLLHGQPGGGALGRPSSTAPRTSRWPPAVNQAYRASARAERHRPPSRRASFSTLSGSLTQGIAPFQTLTYAPAGEPRPCPACPGRGGTGGTARRRRGTGSGAAAPATGGGTGTGSGCAASHERPRPHLHPGQPRPALLGNLGSLPGRPHRGAQRARAHPRRRRRRRDRHAVEPELAAADLVAAAARHGAPDDGPAAPVTGSGAGRRPARRHAGCPAPGVGALSPVLNGDRGRRSAGRPGSTTPSLPSLPLLEAAARRRRCPACRSRRRAARCRRPRRSARPARRRAAARPPSTSRSRRSRCR